jgi:hypothetical protein
MKSLLLSLALVLCASLAYAGIDLESAEAIPQNGGAVFNWVTSREISNYFFDCQRNGVTVGHITGHMTTDQRYEYTWTDSTAQNDTLYTYSIWAVGYDARDTVGVWIIRPPHWVAADEFVLTPGNGGVSLTWITLCELGNNRFEMVRDGVTLDAMSAHNHCATRHFYYWADTAAVNGTTYMYSLVAVHDDGRFDTLFSAQATPLTIGEASRAIPATFAMRAYPNPFNPSSTLAFDLDRESPVRLVIFDTNGREVRVLADQKMSAGEHRFSFDGSALPSGVYFAHLTAGTSSTTQKLLLMK